MGDQIAADTALSTGSNALVVNVPTNAALGQTFGRFRFSSYKGLQPTGIAYDGEVEDHAFIIHQAGPSADIVITNILFDTDSDAVSIKWKGEIPVTYQAQYSDALSTNATWTPCGGYVDTAPYEQTIAVPTRTSRFYRVSAPFTAP